MAFTQNYLQALEALSAYFFSQSSTVTLMYISFIFWGLGISTFSGVLEGWYVNNSNRIGTSIKQSHVFSRVRSISNICTFFGILTSSILATMFSYELTLITISVLLVIYSVFSSFILNNSSLEKEKNNHNISFKEYSYFIFNVNFIRVLLFFSILGFIYSGYAAIWMPVFESVLGYEINYSLIINSLIYGSIYFLSGVAIIYFSKLLNGFVVSTLNQVVVLRMLFASSFFLMAITNQNIFLFSMSTLLMFIFGDLEYGPLSEIKNSFLNNNNRIFGLSVFSTCERVLASLGGFIITALYSNFGTSVTFILVSLLTFLSLLAVTPLIEKNNQMKVY